MLLYSVVTPALIPQLLTVTVQRWPITLLLEGISPLLYELCHWGQDPSDSLNSLEFLWDGNSLLHPWMPQEILNSPNRKGASCHQSTNTACHKNQWRPDPGSQPNSCQYLIPQPPESGPQYFQGQEVLPEDNIQQVLLEGTVLWCFCRDLWVAAAAKVTEVAQPALELRLSSTEVSGKKRDLPLQREPSCTTVLHPPEWQMCQSSEHLQTLLMTLFLTLSLYLPLIVCFLPYQTPLTALASNYNYLQLPAQ